VARLDTIVAVYDALPDAEADWLALEDAARTGAVDVADAALVENQDGNAVVLRRQSRHGWGQGAIVGAVIGVLFPPSLLGAAAVSAGGGELVARMTRSLGRGKVRDLGEAIDSGSAAILVISPSSSTIAVTKTCAAAPRVTTAEGATVEEIREHLGA
jgi:uncharacterized membrane protein